ncbi:MAG: GNAT family N-acetyltransferase [Candidatus Paceibacterota bacterium]
MLTVTEVPTKSIRLSVQIEDMEIGRAWLVLIKNDLHLKPYGLLEDVWVDSNHRKQGHATALVQKIIEIAKQEGCYKIIATSRFEREKVHDLYKHLGFISHGFEFRINL